MVVVGAFAFRCCATAPALARRLACSSSFMKSILDFSNARHLSLNAGFKMLKALLVIVKRGQQSMDVDGPREQQLSCVGRCCRCVLRCLAWSCLVLLGLVCTCAVVLFSTKLKQHWFEWIIHYTKIVTRLGYNPSKPRWKHDPKKRRKIAYKTIASAVFSSFAGGFQRQKTKIVLALRRAIDSESRWYTRGGGELRANTQT
jgi:hypothetical protein